ncbi:MAG TPA: 5-formyltetrahydrofolate cyclo-ligase [Dissulfurispiraceae bacterium]|nr:5-formyltetrahydrofolate cyclo-ligase [Dissulfurispiraceae bacterium]
MSDNSVVSTAQTAKQLIRLHYRKVRDGIAPTGREEKNRALHRSASLLPAYLQSRTVLLYASFGSEVNTWPLIDDCLARDVRTVLPRVDKKEGKLVLYRILRRADLQPGSFGIAEPQSRPEMLVLPAEIDFAFVPGVAFDRTGARIGYGKGFYDRLLADCRAFSAGLCYREQLAENIPCGPHDRRVQIIVTDEGVIDCHGHEKD